MKKTYTTPQIAFESFVLSTNIAGDCEVKTWTPSKGNCAYSYTDEFLGEVKLFTSDVNACKTINADGEYNGICYHVFVDNSLFNS